MKITCRKVGELVHCEVTCDGMSGPITYLHQFHGVSMRQAKAMAKESHDMPGLRESHDKSLARGKGECLGRNALAREKEKGMSTIDKRYREALEEAMNWHNAEARRAVSKSYRIMHLGRVAAISEVLNQGNE